jgi:hypothetical protein
MCICLHVKHSLILSYFNKTWVFSTDFWKKKYFTKLHPVGAELSHADRQTWQRKQSLVAILLTSLKRKRVLPVAGVPTCSLDKSLNVRCITWIWQIFISAQAKLRDVAGGGLPWTLRVWYSSTDTQHTHNAWLKQHVTRGSYTVTGYSATYLLYVNLVGYGRWGCKKCT